MVTTLGEVTARRIGYRSGIKGAVSLFPRDAVLNLPPDGYSWALRRLAVMFCLAVPYEQGHGFVLAATRVSVGRRQLEEIVAAAAGDAERFCQDPARPRDEVLPAAAGGEEEGLPPLAISGDAKGVAMRPEAPRPETARRARKRPGQAFGHRLGTGQKAGSRRMAQTGCVFDVIPAARLPEQVMGRAPGQGAPAGPRAVNRWYACGVAAGRDVAIGKAFGEAERRDPDHRRAW
ncbi:MAG TPA: hypothetical protein VFW50_00305, partial [Streptosporangiaceae bacterium]|nr:hypothetical protein [Streptosporangiaceae bacterium]